MSSRFTLIPLKDDDDEGLSMILYAKVNTPGPEILATRNTSYLTASKSLNHPKIARRAPILTIFLDQNHRSDTTYFLKNFRTNVVVIVASSSSSSSPSSSPSSSSGDFG